MIKNYFKIAWRNLQKNKGYNLINILGLGLGVATAILIFAYVSFEKSFDNFHKDPERIFRIVKETTTKSGVVDLTTGSSLAYQKTLMEQHPELGKFIPIYGIVGPQVTIMKNATQDSPEKYIEEDDGICAGPEFFEVFNFPWLIGNPKSLNEPNVVVLSKDFANKYFGSYEKALGQYIKVNNTDIIRVVGVLEDVPLNTDFALNLVFSYETKRKNPVKWGYAEFDNWNSTSSNDHMYFQLAENQTKEKVNNALAAFSKEVYEGRGDKDENKHFLKEISTMHFDAELDNFKGKVVSKSKLSGISLIGLLIILMACFNFINISTAIINNRMKEVGVRKTLGSLKSQLSAQFLIETFLVAGLSLILGVIVASVCQHWLTELFDLPKDFSLFSNKLLLPFSIILLIAISLLSGLYPSFVMSNFSPLEAFRQVNTSSWRAGFSFRKGLIIFQFAIAIFLIFSTLINIGQLKMLNTKDLGYIKEGVYIFNVDTDLSNRYESLKSMLSNIPEVKSLSFNSDNPSSTNNWQSNFAYDHRAEDEGYNVSLKFSDAEYFETYGLKILAGTIPPNTDTVRRFIVNETFLKKAGNISPKDAVGKEVRLGGNDWTPIAAVVKDFQTASAKEENNPLIFSRKSSFLWQCSIKIQSQNLQATVAKIKAAHDTVFPEFAFNGDFYEETIKNFYKADNQLGLMYKSASIIAIIIACLGLIGMAAFMAEQRKKEIGIRKVMGANIGNILQLLSKDFVVLVLISTLIGFPTAWYFSKEWLQSFVLRIDITWVYFGLTLLLTMMIAMASVSYHALKSALMNPVKSLKSE
ncbi:FtsX-like permease family protein [Lacihabitans sp. LS3-19]|uniref:ABC transporter permease n=1 Tax=Lacihabitans sp. LS3-19 TaxID=2487335 RepID=UPI0020CDE111|nr:ABC transporter permease [Lacihabitans sp. LS3-19]MCP9766519.1 FtsX-like permease family protein [Lacihabitans sp. LS3-19]